MKSIKILSSHIEDEIKDAECYAKEALKYRDDRRGLADVFFQLSLDEMKHMAMLHAEVVKMIEDYRRTNGEPPASMLAVYDYLHQKHIDDAAAVKALQAMYRE